jgi:hypothetical protein
MANATGWTTSGSPANKDALNPAGNFIALAASSGAKPVAATALSKGKVNR